VRVEVGLLGPVELRVDGVPVPLGGLPQRVLLARLALAAGRVVAAGDLIGALWDGEPPDNAVGNLHSYVSRLRRIAGSAAIVREAGGYRLDLPPGAVDLERAEKLAEKPAGTPAAALALWRGDPLADVADRLAFAPDVARLAAWRSQLREEHLEQLLETGRAAEVLPDLEALTTAEPMRERPHLLLIRALHQTGRTAEALETARAFRGRAVDGHGIDPSPAFDELQRRVLAEDPALRPAAKPAPRRRPDRFFGRDAELAAVREALAAGRVTTIAGPGGVGKTRLMTESLTGGELVVELAELSLPADVPAAVAGALGLRAAPRGGAAAIAERLGAQPALLVLDNCEHVLDAVRDLVDLVVSRCPEVRVLATSRQRLGAAGERVLRLGPLPEADRVALFCDRAALLRDGFTGDDPHTRQLAGEVCGLVDGLPLAVELAARREAVFGLAHLRDRLGAGLHVLDPARGGDRATAVSATVEWSYRLLDPEAQRLLDRLSVCRGGFGVEALDHFATGGEQLLAELVDASLVQCDLTGGAPRYRLLETVRHVGLAHLGPDGERAARDAHARWMLGYADDLMTRFRVRNPDSTPALRRELANLQEALTWLHGTADGARLAAQLAAIASATPDPGATAQLALLAPAEVRTEADALLATAAGTAAWLNSDLGTAERLLAAALDRLPTGHELRWIALVVRIANSMFAGRAELVHADALRLLDDPQAASWGIATGLCCKALMDAYGGDPAAGLRWLGTYEKELRTDHYEGFVPFTRGELLAGTDPEAALGWYEESLERSGAIDQVYTGNIARVARAAVLIRLGRRAEAVDACRRTLPAVRAAGMTAQVWTMLRLTAELLAGLGETEAAAAIVTAADTDPYAPAVMGPDRDRQARIRAAAQAQVPAPADPAGFALAALGQAAARGRQARPGTVPA
jgi:predicted ATPase/DNA-binding SARP family transcriptional activator